MSTPANVLEAKIYANAFNLIPEIGPVTLQKIYNHFGDWHRAWIGSPTDYIDAGLSAKTISQIIAKKPKIKPEQSFAELTRKQIEVVLISEAEYPKLLKEIHAAPPIIYVRGEKQALNKLSLAVVGTRKMSNYGALAAEEIVLGLVNNGVTIVSGLAFGIDAQALTTAVANHGSTVAVLASDLNDTSISPRSNFNLSQKIIESGALVSEYPLGMAVQKQNFPIRNRIISGMSLGILVVEADDKSGALITANFALEQNREVFAVPGSIFSPTSRGTNQLIKKGAKLVNTAFDILEELNLDASTLSQPVLMEVNLSEELILKHLSREGLHINELIKAVKLTASLVASNLTLLEMKGRIKNLGAGIYAKIR
ncbi:MAG: DNA-processing protein DprA [Candidatus Doudnabacteria bacterium]